VLEYLVKGLVLGFAAGVMPGPMLGLVIRETLQHGRRAGYSVALAPLITDAPIILAALLIVGALPGWGARALGLAGGGFIIWMGLDALRAPAPGDTPSSAWGSLWRAMLTNWLNPHPWLFWLPVGGPLLAAAWRERGPATVAAFLLGFYGLLVGSKVVLAEVVGRSRRFLQGRAYRWVMRGSGLLLIALGLAVLIEQL